ncbi:MULTISPECIES: ABC transporter ATP-binding protein [Phyllobacteriaceae]|jgi:oligopeptide/dipeptide ABC transporter ATP-binding protein|uniref:Peptide ABC transporter ATP-binding protein n=1 Tax=Mesorhizobium hungaricum TaxID=1566387 RepID=A0A1C2DDZ2_9HYPH|nr:MULTISPECIES: ABC transporter ATP-binding protein [Mesorhizobium]MBN9233004.1 ABC transporter ATP-binding protein [Mesorhizobium sp.]MDQ0330556.1 oligopeptide/dipeptide ABC transporter ATP-binding protein [Mesorhizobium sp. YL-MeA3-2017]OCX12982.1 peptide ABC transporter ATP-binding protein [Mesorhizobium hungaricum]
MSDLLTVSGLSRRFVDGGLLRKRKVFHAVSDVSFNLKRGQILGVVGESGCGKSTLARLVLRLISPSDGQVTFDGVDMASLSRADLRSLRQRMQLVFQDPYSAIDPRYSVRDALLEPFRVQGVKAKAPDETVASLLDMVGLNTSLAQSYPHQLSGGQKQRVGIARALALNPSLVVLDEPTASLDVSVQAQIVSLLERLRQDLGLTYLFISHDLGLVRYFCDQVLVMYLGRVVEMMPSDAEPAHPYTRALLDSTFEPDPRQRRAITRLSGEVPSGYDLPAGCAFANRCPRVSDLCRRTLPPLSVQANGQQVACHHPLVSATAETAERRSVA